MVSLILRLLTVILFFSTISCGNLIKNQFRDLASGYILDFESVKGVYNLVLDNTEYPSVKYKCKKYKIELKNEEDGREILVLREKVGLGIINDDGTEEQVKDMRTTLPFASSEYPNKFNCKNKLRIKTKYNKIKIRENYLSAIYYNRHITDIIRNELGHCLKNSRQFIFENNNTITMHVYQRPLSKAVLLLEKYGPFYRTKPVKKYICKYKKSS